MHKLVSAFEVETLRNTFQQKRLTQNPAQHKLQHKALYLERYISFFFQ